MTRTLLTISLAILIPASALAQEAAGPGRFEFGLFPGGALFFGTSSTEAEPEFGNYTVGGSLTFNINKWVGVEGEVGSAVGVKQTVQFAGEQLSRQSSPCLFAYNANVVLNPHGNDSALIPYLTGGIGGLRMLETDEVRRLGITAATNYLTGNVGAGLKWFSSNRWGVRGDYRLMIVRDSETAPAFFGREEVRYGHRVYAGLLFTY